MAPTKKTGSSYGKSNKLGHGGRAAQLEHQGVPKAVIGEIARKKGFGFEEKARVADFRDPDGNVVKCEVDAQGKPVRVLN